MTRLTAPKRGEELTPLGRATIRFSKYLESLTSSVNASSNTDELIGSFFPAGAAIGELSKRINNLEQSNQNVFNGFIGQLLKDGRTQDSLIAELLSSQHIAIALIGELQAATEVVDVSVITTYTQTKFDDGIFCDATTGDFTVTMIDPALALKKRVALKNETGGLSTITIAPTTGTVEVTSLSDTQSVILAPRAGAWVSV